MHVPSGGMRRIGQGERGGDELRVGGAYVGLRSRARRLALIAACAGALLALAVAASGTRADSPVTGALPPATYPSTYSEQQFITMDDGVKLAATISFPSENGSSPAPGRFPVVLELTPYGRNGVCGCDTASTLCTTRGFVFAVVDTRGTGDSGGNLDGNYFSPREARDGYDLVQYLGTRSWSNGKVGMAGGSYLGIDQYKTAEADPAHLAAIAPDEALADIYNDAFAPGGIMSLSFDAQYLAVQPGFGTSDPETDPSMVPGTLSNVAQQASGTPIALAYLENPSTTPFTGSARRSPR
jgi:predicted acyl esterase